MNKAQKYDFCPEYGNGRVEESDDGDYVRSSDYAALEAERDRLRTQVEAMRGLLLRFSDAYRNTCGSAYKLLPEVDAALQAKP